MLELAGGIAFGVDIGDFLQLERAFQRDRDKAIPLTMNEHVKYEIKQFQTVERNFFINSYKRSGKYIHKIVKELNEAGLPEELAWLPIVESGFNVSALSPGLVF